MNQMNCNYEIAPSVSRLTEDYKNLANRSRDIIYHFDIPLQKFLFFNKEGLELYGFGTKKSVLMKIHPADREIVRRASRESIQSGGMKGETEYRICLGDGTVRWMHDKWTVMRGADGEPLAIEGIIRDQTTKRLIQKELRKNKEHYQMLVDTMSEGLALQNESGVLTYANDALCRMLKYEKRELLGKSILSLFDQTDKHLLARDLKSEPTCTRRFEAICFRKDGKPLHLRISPKAIFDHAGNFQGSFAIITDITDLKKTEQKLMDRENELKVKAAKLQELNSALRVLLKRKEEDKYEIEQNVINNFKEFIVPYLHQLRDGELSVKQKTTLEILECNIEEILSPFLKRLSVSHFSLSPTETQVANFVKQGCTSKEIAKMMGLAIRTVENHRNHIRKKLKIGNKKMNMRSVLLSLQQEHANCSGLFSLVENAKPAI